MHIKSVLPFIFLLLPIYTMAQYPGIDSIKISPKLPTTSDTVVAYAYVVTYDDATHFDETINIVDTSIFVSSCYVNSSDLTQGSYIDTMVLGVLGSGNYTIVYHFKQISVAESDTSNYCRTTPYYDSSYFHFTVHGTSASDELFDNENIHIYPNPSSNKIEIDFNNQLDRGNISILNIEGQTLIKVLISLNGKSEINIESLPTGMYFLMLEDEKQQWVRKFVKE